MNPRVRRVLRRFARRVPARARRAVVNARVPANVVRKVRSVDWGSLRRAEPIDGSGGRARGTAVDDHYAHRFLRAHRDDLRGRILVFRSERWVADLTDDSATIGVLDLDPANAAATLIADLAEAGSLGQAAFDCLVLVDALRDVPDVGTAVSNAWASLAPGGVLLLTIPAVDAVRGRPERPDRWRFLRPGLEEVLRHACPGADVEMVGFGNLVSSVALLAGVAAEELRDAELDRQDDRYPVVVAARLRKAG